MSQTAAIDGSVQEVKPSALALKLNQGCISMLFEQHNLAESTMERALEGFEMDLA